ncbi:MAG: S-methyl-5-thioribose-1-phosphate isomerase, partial [Lachnospiraceae bacterium]|nr:S-methyl-5-thioribose-1-phosphate isomerase [Lachnospiraceae bacterium]
MDDETVELDDNDSSVVIIDQTKLPGKTEIIRLHTAQELWDAIYLLKVRGAPAIGVAAAFGIYVLAKGIVIDAGYDSVSDAEEMDFGDFYDKFREQKEYLNSSRPTAVNLSWALNRMEAVC